MAVALGTSTPTSITVVATSTSSSPRSNARITVSFSSAGSLPCRIPIRSPCSAPSASCGRHVEHRVRRAGGARSPSVVGSSSGSTSSASPTSSPPTRGHTTYAWWPAATSSRTRAHTRSTQAGFSASGTTVVAIGERPRGSSRSAETARSP